MPAVSRRHAVVSFAAFAAAGMATTAARAQALIPLRLGTLVIESAGVAFYAKDLDLYAKAGLDVEIQPMTAVSPTAAALAGGAIDVGLLTIETLAQTHRKNLPFVVIAPGNDYGAPSTKRVGGAPVVPENSTVQKASDLNGKTIATPSLLGFIEIGSRVWIDQNGGDSSTVKYVEIPFPQIPAAIEAGRVDGAMVTEPFLSVAKRHGRVLYYGFDGIGKSFLVSAFVATKQWAQDHADVVRRFAGAIHEAAVWANENPAKSAAIIAKYTKADPAAVASMARAHFAEQLTAASMQPLIDVIAKYNKFDSFPAQDLVFAPGGSR